MTELQFNTGRRDGFNDGKSGCYRNLTLYVDDYVEGYRIGQAEGCAVADQMKDISGHGPCHA